jgi:hypothetical protein
MHVRDLKKVLAAVDLDWKLDGRVDHYADVCPACRRRLFGFTQGALLGRAGNVDAIAVDDEPQTRPTGA